METEREARTVRVEHLVGRLRDGPNFIKARAAMTEAANEIELLHGLIVELLDTELGEMACTGSMAPVEDVLGRMADAVTPNA